MILQMRALYEDKDCKVQHGYSSYYYANGRIQSFGRRNHGKREGVCVLYYSDGMMLDSATYHDGVPVGSRFRWHRNGYLSDSTVHLNDSMDVQVNWFDNGAPFSGGRFLNGKMHGIWKFYHRNGKLAGEEIYDKGFVVSKTYYNEDGSLQPDTAKANIDAVF
jgi:antitoxin component YwqK of YwqJK toxin-antitoxin module